MDVAMFLAFCWSLLLCTWRIIAEYSIFHCLYKELPAALEHASPGVLSGPVPGGGAPPADAVTRDPGGRGIGPLD